MKIALIFNKDRADTTGTYFERVLQKSRQVDYKHFPLEGFSKPDEDFDLFLRIDHGDYKYDLPQELHPAAFLAIDTHLKKPFKKIVRQAGHYDFLFATQKEGARRLEKKLKRPVYWIPLACDPEIHRQLDTPKKYDVGFVGSYGGAGSLRENTLKKIKKKYPHSFIGNAPHLKMSGIYSSSRIGINFSLNNDINMRIFEVLSCGAMLITSRIEKNGLDELFEERKHLITYETSSELINLIDYYLEHKEEREHIAGAGHQLAIKKHTYKNRLRYMFDIIREKDKTRFKGLKL